MLRLELLLHNSGRRPHRVTYSLAAVNTTHQHHHHHPPGAHASLADPAPAPAHAPQQSGHVPAPTPQGGMGPPPHSSRSSDFRPLPRSGSDLRGPAVAAAAAAAAAQLTESLPSSGQPTPRQHYAQPSSIPQHLPPQVYGSFPSSYGSEAALVRPHAVQQYAVQPASLSHAHTGPPGAGLPQPYAAPALQPQGQAGAKQGRTGAVHPSMADDASTAGVGGTAGAVHVEHGIDPGLVLVGAVQHVHVAVEPRSTVRQPLMLALVQPGLYQLYVYDVCVVPEGMDAGLWAGRPGQAPQPVRVYASMDRLNVLCV